MLTGRNVVSRALTVALLGACMGALLCAGAVAQPGGGPGGGPASPEMAVKAQAMEATTVAQSLSLPEDKTVKLVDAYKAARESHMTAMRAVMKPGERPDFQAMQGVTQAEAAKFETAIKAFLKPEQAATAVAALGTFNRRWDRMVMTLDGLGLADKPKADAMKLVMDSVTESGKAMKAMTGSTDRDALRIQQEKLRENLDAALAKVLSPEQLEKWKAETTMRGGGGRRGGPGFAPGAPAPKPEPAPAPASAPAAK